MTNNLPTIKQNTATVLSKTKNMMSITNKILSKKGELSLIDDSWMERLWAWADENNIPDLEWVNEYEGYWRGLPRDKEKLIDLEILNIDDLNLYSLPAELSNLKNLRIFSCIDNNLKSLPVELCLLVSLEELRLDYNKFDALPTKIGNLINLKVLQIEILSLTEVPQSIVNLKKLTNLSFYEFIKFTEEQEWWIYNLINNGCEVYWTMYTEPVGTSMLFFNNLFEHIKNKIESSSDEENKDEILF